MVYFWGSNLKTQNILSLFLIPINFVFVKWSNFNHNHIWQYVFDTFAKTTQISCAPLAVLWFPSLHFPMSKDLRSTLSNHICVFGIPHRWSPRMCVKNLGYVEWPTDRTRTKITKDWLSTILRMTYVIPNLLSNLDNYCIQLVSLLWQYCLNPSCFIIFYFVEPYYWFCNFNSLKL